MEHPKIGLALGSGGARGFAHLGVIKALKDAEIPIHLIAGSSMGALVASFYGAGIDMDRLYKLSTAFKRKYFLDFTVPKMGFISGKKVKEFIKVFTHGKNIEDLSIPIGIVATDLLTGEKVVFQTGPVADAVRASISIPGIFVPEKYNGRILVDGGVSDRIPVSVAKEMGADIVIAVDVSRVKRNAEITSIYDVIMQSIDIMQAEIINNREIAASVMIRPPVEIYSSRAFTNIDEIINLGEEEAKKHLKQIKTVIEQWKG
ncbi:patatin-like phospholipase family protein [Bacillus sp. ISL-40]|jgi:NTE family protein|uniref:patatin-like phospholipase family protein n=1 Tax=unclassified Bacillus (in: firmicutes) TaxID=185979 RepID=UPI001BE92746|nr:MULTISPECIES: patatin-like phospholipase family protein [unclassified Bacillus (in: firmicutes)]MBT2697714.1 patatin-like phospholipase family protein [Bacillus sp. ISL-40]MBT2722539.1 patatin-like phospholipase family protein [Bacillus sp. ISL-46]MBT2742354.1 patatin-like phospholipase family protein [Bacillus sp. ISL-77]